MDVTLQLSPFDNMEKKDHPLPQIACRCAPTLAADLVRLGVRVAEAVRLAVAEVGFLAAAFFAAGFFLAGVDGLSAPSAFDVKNLIAPPITKTPWLSSHSKYLLPLMTPLFKPSALSSTTPAILCSMKWT
eukprot:TRINITY_DN11937_c2_g1_i2.p2 TRINITY_DN11937_c2_g1~~TRINITY_DN11937_c2_g1_i2.p2  ORF type:complete len:130 (-),score=13.52 TRINITY_DN11937_c2_g1_i2:103-492(-)